MAYILGFALAAWLGYWLAGTAAPKRSARAVSEPVDMARTRPPLDETQPVFRRADREPAKPGDPEAAELGALQGQRVITFSNREAMEKFLARMGGDVWLMGRLDALNSLRIGFSDYADLAGLLNGDEDTSFIFPVYTPPLPDGSVQPGAVALGNRLLEWLGITADVSNAGAGVRIAILDTGVASHASFKTNIRSINLVDMPGDPSALNGHGTAVASMIIGTGSLTPGVAPGADIISVRVADDSGQSNSFLLAQGIIAAVDAGARLINISMGGPGESALLDQAYAYAQERGVLIFAAAGNNGMNQVHNPAANNGVIAVGSVDAKNNHLEFSNTGMEIDVSAPGYAVNAALPGDQAGAMSGTSFSTPIVVGAVAHVMTEAGDGNLTPSQAWELISNNLKDGDAAGQDSYLGAGMPDIGMALAAGTPGIYDAAVASQRILPPNSANPYGQIEILIQNRGTEPLVNTALNVSNAGTRSSYNVTTLAPNGVTTVRVPVARPAVSGSPAYQVEARVSLNGGVVDARPGNDLLIEAYAPAGSR